MLVLKADEAAHESRLSKQDRYAEMRRRKDEEREAQERALVGDHLCFWWCFYMYVCCWFIFWLKPGHDLQEEEAKAQKAREEEAAALEFEQWKGEFSIDAEGTTENEVQDGGRDLLADFVEYIKVLPSSLLIIGEIHLENQCLSSLVSEWEKPQLQLQ